MYVTHCCHYNLYHWLCLISLILSFPHCSTSSFLRLSSSSSSSLSSSSSSLNQFHSFTTTIPKKMSSESSPPTTTVVVCEEMSRLNSVLPNAEGLVFDCDGTLLDTMPIYYESWKRTCDEVGLEFPIERFYEMAGATVYDIFETLIQEQTTTTTTTAKGDDMLLKKEDGNKTLLTASYCEGLKRKHHEDVEREGRIAGPIDIVVDIVKHSKTKKIPIAVASSGWRDHVIGGLERNGLLHLFDAVVTADEDDVKNPKPAPDIFQVAAKRLSICPTKCIGFEDANFGIQSIQSANYMYACDVRKLYMYPRNIEQRLQLERTQKK